jgi:hypothetical protein
VESEYEVVEVVIYWITGFAVKGRMTSEFDGLVQSSPVHKG